MAKNDHDDRKRANDTAVGGKVSGAVEKMSEYRRVNQRAVMLRREYYEYVLVPKRK